MRRQIHLIRHGQSTANVALANNGVDPLEFDARLSPLGEEQLAAARLRHDDIHYDLVVTSPLTRAIQTTLGIFGHRGALPILVEHLHREGVENSGDIGRSPAELAVEFPHLSFDHLPPVWWYAANDGPRNSRGIVLEPHDGILGRVESFRHWLRSRPERSIAVVGHGNFTRHVSGTFLDNCQMIAVEI